MEIMLFWIYLLNSILLINHEIDSAYWKEWNLFHLPGGIGAFLLLHFPLLFVVLFGLVEIKQVQTTGLIISFLLGAGGIFAFTIHRYFIRKGHQEFRTAISQFILYSTLIVSTIQLILTVYLFVK